MVFESRGKWLRKSLFNKTRITFGRCQWVLGPVFFLVWKLFFSGKKVIVYTGVFGGTSRLRSPIPLSFFKTNVDFVCFTDEKLISDTWEIREVDRVNQCPVSTAKFYKMNPHKHFDSYEYAIWHDATIALNADPRYLILKYLVRSDFAIHKNPFRDSVHAEAQACIDERVDKKEVNEEQVRRYERAGFPDNGGLVESAVLLMRHHKPHVRKMLEDWYGEIVNGSIRDQLSFNYTAWKNNFKYIEIKTNVRRSMNYIFLKHDRKNIINRARENEKTASGPDVQFL